MERLGGLAATCAIGASVVLGVPAALAGRPARVPGAHVAGALARIIRRDARQQLARHRGAVTVTKRCCGVRSLRVHYRVQPKGDVRRASYELSLITRHGIILEAGIAVSSSEAGSGPGAGRWEKRWRGAFAIERSSGGPDQGWSVHGSYEEAGDTVGGPAGGARSGLGFARECRLPGPVPRLLYEKLLLMLARAKRRVLSPQPLPACG